MDFLTFQCYFDYCAHWTVIDPPNQNKVEKSRDTSTCNGLDVSALNARTHALVMV